MGVLGFLKELAGAMARDALRTSDRVERKYGNRMSSDQRKRFDRARGGLNAIDEWSRRKGSNGK